MTSSLSVFSRTIDNALCCMSLVCLVLLLSGCQQLFHAQDSPLKGQAVTVSMTVPTPPPPSAKPLPQTPALSPTQIKPAQASLDTKLLPVQSPASPDPLTLKTTTVSDRPDQPKPSRSLVLKADTVLAGKTVTEDLVLRGTVLVRGSLVVLPQATLRIEPGTVVRFTTADGSAQLPRIVVQGRIVATGTAQQPIVLGPAFNEPAAGDWGGVVLLNSEKKNSLDHCRIEGAQTALEAHFSRVSGRGLVILRSQTGVALFDSEAVVQGSAVSRCDTGYRLSDSDLDLKESTIRENRVGVEVQRSSFTLSGVKVLNNSQEGVLADQARFRINNCLFAENRCGIRLITGDGQIFLSRFYGNRENAAELTGVRIRIATSSFFRNGGAGLLVENARGSIVGSSLGENKAGNLITRGNESFVALLNWWGSADEKQIAAGIIEPTRKESAGSVLFAPFLKERPVTAP